MVLRGEDVGVAFWCLSADHGGVTGGATSVRGVIPDGTPGFFGDGKSRSPVIGTSDADSEDGPTFVVDGATGGGSCSAGETDEQRVDLLDAFASSYLAALGSDCMRVSSDSCSMVMTGGLSGGPVLRGLGSSSSRRSHCRSLDRGRNESRSDGCKRVANGTCGWWNGR